MGDASLPEDLPVLPPGLERRRGCAALSGFGAVALVLATSAELLVGTRPATAVWATALAGAALLAAVTVAIARTVSPAERDLIERSQQWILPALVVPPGADRSPVRVGLAPGWFESRRLRDRPELRCLGLARIGDHPPVAGLSRF